jgi:hypothetical protein
LLPHGGRREFCAQRRTRANRAATARGFVRRRAGAFPRYERGERRGTQGVPALNCAFPLLTGVSKEEKLHKEKNTQWAKLADFVFSNLLLIP